jgi:PAT family beta-lactamase induction signal transducer AmpG
LQTLSNLVFSWLSVIGLNHWALTAAIVAENFTGAIGTVIFVAYLSALCKSPLHTATQFALLTALSAVARTYLSAGAGFVAESSGWFWFFVISVALAIPSFILLVWLQARGHFREFDKRNEPVP